MDSEKKIIDRGEWLKSMIKTSGFSYKLIADLIGMNKSSIFRMVQDPNLDFRRMKLVADAMNLDLRKDFPETEMLYNNSVLNYKSLYELESKKVLELQERLEKYEQQSGQNRDDSKEK